MPPIEARTEVVVQFGTEFGGDAGVFDEYGMLAVGVVGVEGGRRYVLGNPVWVSSLAVEG